MLKNGFQNEIPKSRINLKLTLQDTAGVKKKELPLKLLVLGNFSNNHQGVSSIWEKEPLRLTKDNKEAVFKSINASLQFSVDNKLVKDVNSQSNSNIAVSQQLPVNIKINDFKSFKPNNIIEQVPQLQKLIEIRQLLRELKSHMQDDKDLKLVLNELASNIEKRKALIDFVESNNNQKNE